MAVLLIGTLDTKGTEIAFVREQILAAGLDVLVVDAGVLNPPALAPDISRDQLYAAAGTSCDALKKAADRGKAIKAAARGAAKLAQELHATGRVDGVLSLGGSAGTTIGTAAMRALPFGVPKLMGRPLARGQGQHFVGGGGVNMPNLVVDISGFDRITRHALT